MKVWRACLKIDLDMHFRQSKSKHKQTKTGVINVR